MASKKTSSKSRASKKGARAPISKPKASKPKASKPSKPKAAKPKAPKPSTTVESKLFGALEMAQDIASDNGFPTRLNVRRPIGSPKAKPDQWKSPWSVIGEFTFVKPIGYADLYELLQSWDTHKLDKRIGAGRVGRIRVVYSDKGETDEHSLSETFAWRYALARAITECNPDVDKSLADRYRDSLVIKLIVWLSEEMRSGV